ncbi:MAG: putative signal transduction protein with domain [Ilumatobacteraceae bacterium]|nr:putative signal transduction protein with domain [Ilumatobacteraceae bacterium]
MQVSVLLQAKGTEVVTVAPDATIAEVAIVLAERRIGAVVVTTDGTSIDGVLSERDIVRALARPDGQTLAATARSLMTAEVVTCQPDTTLDELMATMTERRIRHIPVVVDGSLAGLISIGDVVKHHIASLEHEKQAMHDYISNPY